MVILFHSDLSKCNNCWQLLLIESNRRRSSKNELMKSVGKPLEESYKRILDKLLPSFWRPSCVQAKDWDISFDKQHNRLEIPVTERFMKWKFDAWWIFSARFRSRRYNRPCLEHCCYSTGRPFSFCSPLPPPVISIDILPFFLNLFVTTSPWTGDGHYMVQEFASLHRWCPCPVLYYI